MTIVDFLRMDEMEQAETIWSGRHVSTRHDNEYDILLYRIDDLFVEVYYHREYNVINKLLPLENKQDLAPYINLNHN